MKTKKYLILALTAFGIFCSSVGWADSRSVTVRVSCTILPALELTTMAPKTVPTPLFQSSTSSMLPARNLLTLDFKDAGVHANANLGSQYSMSQKLVKIGNENFKLFSLTAL